VLPEKKREDHAESGEEEEGGTFEIDFAWVVFTGLRMGYREREVKHLSYGKWSDLFGHYRKMHNADVKKMVFEEPEKEVSILDL